MSDLPLHPAIVHLPLGLALILPLLAAMVLLGWREALLPKRAWWMVVALQGVLFVSAFASMQIGEQAEHAVGNAVPHAAISTHEDRAKAFTITSGVLLLLGLVAGASIDRRGQLLAGITTLGMVADAGLGVYTGIAGGELVYTHGAAAAHASKAGKSGKSGKSDGGKSKSTAKDPTKGGPKPPAKPPAGKSKPKK
ncbi:MAG: hypothetical protein H6733_04335 [Alphaproteobacteria bacterium]|nr:hypothetical protein [Alphaproteobacteria bacterium]